MPELIRTHKSKVTKKGKKIRHCRMNYLIKAIAKNFETDSKKINSLLLELDFFESPFAAEVFACCKFSAETLNAPRKTKRLPTTTRTANMARNMGFGFIYK